VPGILRYVFKFIFKKIWKKEMSPEAPVESVKDFPILLGPFTKLQKGTISFVMPVPPAVCTPGKIWFPRDGFSRNLIPVYFLNFVKKIQVSLKSDKNNV